MQNGSSLRWIPIFSLYLMAAAMGVTQCFLQTQTIFLLLSNLLAVPIADWIRLDSRFRGRPFPHIVHCFFWYLPIPSIILYMLWARKLRGLGWLLLHAVGLAVVLIGSFYATVMLAFDL